MITALNARTNLLGDPDESLLGNTYVQPHLAGNFGGAIRAAGSVASSTFVQPYIEGDIHSNCEVAANNVFIGRDLSSINTHPTLRQHGHGLNARFNQLEFNWGWDSPGAIAGRCLAFRSALGGLTLQGHGGNDDVTILNRGGDVALRVPGERPI